MFDTFSSCAAATFNLRPQNARISSSSASYRNTCSLTQTPPRKPLTRTHVTHNLSPSRLVSNCAQRKQSRPLLSTPQEHVHKIVHQSNPSIHPKLGAHRKIRMKIPFVHSMFRVRIRVSFSRDLVQMAVYITSWSWLNMLDAPMSRHDAPSKVHQIQGLHALSSWLNSLQTSFM